MTQWYTDRMDECVCVSKLTPSVPSSCENGLFTRIFTMKHPANPRLIDLMVHAPASHDEKRVGGFQSAKESFNILLFPRLSTNISQPIPNTKFTTLEALVQWSFSQHALEWRKPEQITTVSSPYNEARVRMFTTSKHPTEHDWKVRHDTEPNRPRATPLSARMEKVLYRPFVEVSEWKFHSCLHWQVVSFSSPGKYNQNILLFPSSASRRNHFVYKLYGWNEREVNCSMKWFEIKI